jgi:tRNA modification GTPase
LVLNKIDKKIVLNKKNLKENFNNILDIVEISAKYEKNINLLLKKMVKIFSQKEKDVEYLAMTERQKELFLKLYEEAKNVINKREKGFGEEILAEHVRNMREIIGELTGRIYNEEILEKIFSSFCIGK